MKKIEEVQKLRRQQETAHRWAKIVTVILTIFGWLILASSIGRLDPQGNLWWLQIALIGAAIFGCVKLPLRPKPIPFPEITYEDKIEFTRLIDAATYAYYDLLSFLLNTAGLNSNDASAIMDATGTPNTGWNEHEPLRQLTSFLAFRRVPEEYARDIVKEAAFKIHLLVEANVKMVETVPSEVSPLLWSSEILGYTIPEGEPKHAEKDLYAGV